MCCSPLSRTLSHPHDSSHTSHITQVARDKAENAHRGPLLRSFRLAETCCIVAGHHINHMRPASTGPKAVPSLAIGDHFSRWVDLMLGAAIPSSSGAVGAIGSTTSGVGGSTRAISGPDLGSDAFGFVCLSLCVLSQQAYRDPVGLSGTGTVVPAAALPTYQSNPSRAHGGHSSSSSASASAAVAEVLGICAGVGTGTSAPAPSLQQQLQSGQRAQGCDTLRRLFLAIKARRSISPGPAEVFLGGCRRAIQRLDAAVTYAPGSLMSLMGGSQVLGSGSGSSSLNLKPRNHSRGAVAVSSGSNSGTTFSKGNTGKGKGKDKDKAMKKPKNKNMFSFLSADASDSASGHNNALDEALTSEAELASLLAKIGPQVEGWASCVARTGSVRRLGECCKHETDMAILSRSGGIYSFCGV